MTWGVIFFLILLFPSKAFAQTQPVINEFSVHPSTGNKEWVEFYVFDQTDISTYWIDDDSSFSDDSGNGSKKRLTEVTRVADDHYFIIEVSSLFNNDGDSVALFTPEGSLLDQITYTSDPGTDMTIGRSPDGTGGFAYLEKATKGEKNSSPVPEATSVPESANTTITPQSAVVGRSNDTSSSEATGENTSVNPNRTATTQTVGRNTINALFKDYPTPILGTSSAQKATNSAKSFDKAQDKSIANKQQVLVKDAQGKNPAALASLFIGGILFIACAILIFLKKRRSL